MKVLIVSDTHGRHTGLDRVLEKEGKIDLFIHLGDIEGGESYINSVVECEKHMVRGNNDFFSDLPREEEIDIGGYKAFITHGHPYYVSLDSEYIREEGAARKVDIVMFGHTHKPYFEQKDGITVLNPGSLAYPRDGMNGKYMLLEFDQHGTPFFAENELKPKRRMRSILEDMWGDREE